jgi:hypothetical protein
MYLVIGLGANPCDMDQQITIRFINQCYWFYDVPKLTQMGFELTPKTLKQLCKELKL